MGETTAVAHGGNPQDRTAFPRPRCMALQPRGNHGSRSWGEPRQSLMGGTTAVAHGGNHGSRSWGEPPLAALPSQDRAAFPRPRCLPKTALPSQDRAASPRPRCIASRDTHTLETRISNTRRKLPHPPAVGGRGERR